jgi:cytochrome c-type biogenesis protein CcmH/NrfF
VSNGHRRRVATAAVWVALAVVLAVALAFGASRGAGTQTPAERAAALDGILKCPSCDGISVADSSAATARPSARSCWPGYARARVIKRSSSIW